MKNLLKLIGALLFVLSVTLAFADTAQNVIGLKTLKKGSGDTITAAAMFDSGRACYFGTGSGKIYFTNKNGTIKYYKSANGEIESILNTAGGRENRLGRFTFIADGTVYTYNKKNDNYTPLKALKGEAKELTYDRNSGSLDCKTNKGVWYYYLNGKWVAKSSKNSLLSSVQPKTDSSTYSINKYNDKMFSTKNRNISQKQSNSVSSNRSVFTWNAKGETKTYLQSSHCIVTKIEYVSVADTCPTDAIYRVTIEGFGLTQDSLFIDGYNGISYTVADESGGHKITVYPITGYINTGDGIGKTCIVMPRSITFLWRGPLSKTAGDHKVVVNESFQNMNTNLLHNVDSNESHVLPVKTAWTPSESYAIHINESQTTVTVNCYANGVSLTPVRVAITAGTSGAVLPSDNEAYDHLVFYSEDGLIKVNPIHPIGCNPYDLNTNYMSITSKSCAEIDGKVKYGTADSGGKGRVFYLTAGDGAKTRNIRVGFIADDGTYNSGVKSVEFTVNPVSSSASSLTYLTGLNSNEGRSFTFSDSSEVSSWEGDSEGHNAGYLDFVCPPSKYKNDKGVYVLFPQGLNTLQLIPDRLNPSKMQVGYYFEPNGNSDGLHADQYSINDKTSYCAVLKGLQLYSYLFDQYGRYAKYSPIDPNMRSANWDKKISVDGYTHIRLTNWSNVPICFHSNDNKLGVSKNCKGVFMPPESTDNPGVDFITDYNTSISNTDTRTLYIYGSSICSAAGIYNAKISPTDTSLYDYFWTKLSYKTILESDIYTMDIHSDSGVPDKTKVACAEDGFRDLYLPLNQIEGYINVIQYFKLMFWGVHFVEWDRSGYAADKHAINGDGFYFWGYQQSGSNYDKKPLVKDYDRTDTAVQDLSVLTIYNS